MGDYEENADAVPAPLPPQRRRDTDVDSAVATLCQSCFRQIHPAHASCTSCGKGGWQWRSRGNLYGAGLLAPPYARRRISHVHRAFPRRAANAHVWRRDRHGAGRGAEGLHIGVFIPQDVGEVPIDADNGLAPRSVNVNVWRTC